MTIFHFSLLLFEERIDEDFSQMWQCRQIRWGHFYLKWLPVYENVNISCLVELKKQNHPSALRRSPSFDAVWIRSMEYVYDFLSSFSCKFRSNSNTIPFRMALWFRLILYISSFLPNAEDKSNMERKIDLKERLLQGKNECQREDVVGFMWDDLWCLSLIDMKRRGYWRPMLS